LKTNFYIIKSTNRLVLDNYSVRRKKKKSVNEHEQLKKKGVLDESKIDPDTNMCSYGCGGFDQSK
jgi:hypothetical protein